MRWGVGLSLVALALGGFVPEPVHAQRLHRELLRAPSGMPLDLPRNGGWRPRAAAVARYRAGLRSSGRIAALNAGPRSPAVLSGTFRLPAILFGYPGWATFPVERYDSLLFGDAAPLSWPYTLRQFYAEMSNDVFDLQGDVYGWFIADSARAYYVSACGTNANPLDCDLGVRRMYEALVRALAAADSVVDFAQYDNDGPDDVPNSGDDDGVVDVVHFMHPDVGGECGGYGHWSHHWSIAALGSYTGAGGGPFATNDQRPDGSAVVVDGYIVTAGAGGTTCASAGFVAPIGIIAHELGHALGLPDLYDADPTDEDDGEGIGEWGLMGSGNYTSVVSPAHFSAWSKERLGWVTVRELTGSGNYVVGPVVSGDTVLLVRPGVPNARGEYWLMENKQPLGADQENLRVGGQTGPKVGGLLVWHIDSARIAEAEWLNRVNTGPIHGVRLIEADGSRALDYWGYRGDAGDPFPGTWGQTALGLRTRPSLQLNAGGFTGLRLDSITQVTPEREMSLRLTTGNLTVVRASDTSAYVLVDGEGVPVYRDLWRDGETHRVAVPPQQPGGGGRFLFLSWSDGLPREHDVAGSTAGDTLVAQVGVQYALQLWVYGGSGAVGFLGDALVPASWTYHNPGDTVTVVAVPNAGSVFRDWVGSVPSTEDTLELVMDGYREQAARFAQTLAIVTDSLRPGRVLRPYADTLVATGGAGPYHWTAYADWLPRGLRLDSTGVLWGVPEQPWSQPINVAVWSGSYRSDRDLRLTISTPTLALDSVVGHLLGTGSPIGADGVEWLDFIGNQNGRIDSGDVYRWLAATNQLTPTAPAPAGKNR